MLNASKIAAYRPGADPASLGAGWDGGVDGDAGGMAAGDSACWVSVPDADTAGAALSVLWDDTGFCGDAAWGEAGSESMLVACSGGGVWCVSGRSAGGMAQTATELLSRCSNEVWSYDSAGDDAGTEQSALRERARNGRRYVLSDLGSLSRSSRVLGLYGREEAADERRWVGNRSTCVLSRVCTPVSDYAQARGSSGISAARNARISGLHATSTAAPNTGDGATSACGSRLGPGPFLRAVRAEV